MRLRHRNNPKTTNAINAARPTPMPIPAFAPVERPPEVEDEVEPEDGSVVAGFENPPVKAASVAVTLDGEVTVPLGSFAIH